MSHELDVLADVRDSYVAAANSGDIDRWLATLTDDVVMMPPDAPAVAGREATRTWIAENFFDPFDMDLGVRFDDGEVHGSTAWTRGSFTLALTPRDGGDTMNVNGKFVNVFRQDDDGAWKYATVIWNADAPVEAG